MFGMSWGQIFLIVLVAVFVLGPERIPHVVSGATGALRRLRTFAGDSRSNLLGDVGPEIAELRSQLAELQALVGVQELRSLRELHPQRLITQIVLGEGAAAPDAAHGPPAGTADRAGLESSSRRTPPTSQPVN